MTGAIIISTMRQTDEGFTIVEVIVAIIIAVLFIGIFLQGFAFASATIESNNRKAAATLVANSNLLKYRFKDHLIGFDCRIHLDANSGLVVLNNSSANKEPIPTGNYGGYFSQKVVAYTRHRDNPASNTNNSKDCRGIVTVESTVKYGPVQNRVNVVEVRYAKED